jgi:hypothetical protein
MISICCMRHTDDFRDSRRTYWPRYGPAVPPPDIAEDRHCVQCGYNLRGLPYNTTCPECGSESGMSPSDVELPWDQQRTLGSYFATLFQIFFDADDFGSHVWRFGHLDWRSARRFRQINTAIGVVSFGIVIYVLIAHFTRSPAVIPLAFPVSMIGVLLWFRTLTLDRLRFLERENLLPRDPQRTKALISYLSAPLALSPLHLLALHWSMELDRNTWPLAISIHVIILILQLLLIARADTHLLWQLIDMHKAQALFIGYAGAIMHIITGIFYCVALPAAFTVLAKNVVGE